ncbi:MAG TPA: glycosyltransferase family 4 protein [Candidatus Saccharimonadales bacterium]|jgi:glycosyltransferase involved in cell wall biosynthesis|nr:glycosyltransferase family 4 protein [Candidatus Saccharimonadales bacterium]
MRWAIITGEYPPQPGGVSDYTRMVARALAAAGDGVHIWTTVGSGETQDDPGVFVHRLRAGFGVSGLASLGAELDSLPRPYRILVQYLPHAFGWKAMNLPFCLWLWTRRRAPVWVMFHEVVFPLHWPQPFRQIVLGLVTRLMAAVTVQSAERIFISTAAWERFLRPFAAADKPIMWLPVPSNVNGETDLRVVRPLRKGPAMPEEILIGHFGTYGTHSRNMLQCVIPRLLAKDPNRRVLLLGRGSRKFREDLVKLEPLIRDQVVALDGTSAGEVNARLSACDLVLQPYPDGITTRRSSSMAALALGVPIVTNQGALSEPLWRESGAVALAQDHSPDAFVLAVDELLCSPDKRAELLHRSVSLYSSRFAIEHVLKELRVQA